MSEGFKGWQKEGALDGNEIVQEAKKQGKLYTDGYREGAFEIMKEEAPTVTTEVQGIKREDAILYKKKGSTLENMASEIENVRSEQIKTIQEFLAERNKQLELYEEYKEKNKESNKQYKILNIKLKELADVSNQSQKVWYEFSLNNEKGLEILKCIEEKRCLGLYTNKQIREVMPKTLKTKLQLLLGNLPFLREKILEPFAEVLANEQKEKTIEESQQILEQYGELEKKIKDLRVQYDLEQKILDEKSEQADEILVQGEKIKNESLDPKFQKIKGLTGHNREGSENEEQVLN